MAEDIRIWMHQVLSEALHDALHPVEQDPEDDRVKISDATRARMEAKGLTFPLPSGPLTVVMLDDIVHTEHFPICADSEHCICAQCERDRVAEEIKPKRRPRRKVSQRNYEQEVARNTAPLNGNRSFNLMR
jgi:hypothetical protein